MFNKTISFLLTLFIFFTIGCSNNNHQSSTQELSTEIKKTSFKFNKDQLNFLNSLGIKEVLSLEEHGTYKLFWYDGEQFEVYINDKNGITEVKNGTRYPYIKTLWDDQNGKTGMLRAERAKYLNNFIENSNKKYDQGEQITWIDTTNIYKNHHKGIFTYMGLKGKNYTSPKWLRVVLHYSSYDWIFFNRVTFSNENESWTYFIDDLHNITRDVFYGGVIHEVYDVNLNKVRPGLEIITRGKNPRIDFKGEHYRDGRNLNEYDIRNAKTYLLLQDIIDGE